MVLTSVNMMAKTNSDSALVERLERLSNGEESCCVPEYEALARSVTSSVKFEPSLRRAKALADENRLLALALLKRRGELCACEIQAATGLTHATVSHHMALLGEAGFVTARREGKWLYYRLAKNREVAIP